jgi:hypothetical protein
MPYGYYQFLRIIITIVAGSIAYDLFQTNKKLLFRVFVGIAVLYNPVVVIHLDKLIWSTLNIFTAAFFLAFVFVSKNKITP